MSIERTIPVNGFHDFEGQAKPKNIQQATEAGDAVEYAQNLDALALKQDNNIAGAGVSLDGATINVALSSSASDYSELTLNGATDGSLDGVYSRLSYAAYVVYKSGTDGDYDLKHNEGGFSGFYKDNGNGTWDVIFAEDTAPGTPNSNNQWAAFRVAINPTTVTSDITDYILDSNSGVKFNITSGHDQDELGRKVPTESDANIDYGAGASDSFLGFDGGKLKVSVTQDPAQASTTNIMSGHAVKTYVDEQDVISRSASSNSFSNVLTLFDNNVNNVQSAIEEAKIIIDSNTNAVSGVVTVNNTQGNQINAHSNVIGVNNNDTTMGTWGGSGSIFLSGATTAKEGIEAAATGAVTALNVIGTVTGLGQGESNFGDLGSNLPQDSNAKDIFLAIDTNIANLSQGVGVYWTPCDVHEDTNIDLSNPATDTFGGSVAAQGDRVLVLGQTAASQNGIYIFDTTSTSMVRATDADASTDFAPNKTVQVLRSTEDGISGATFAYNGVDDPNVGTNVLPFSLKSKGVVGDATITEAKLESTLANKINAKVVTVSDDAFSLSGGGAQDIFTHSLNNQNVIVQVYGDSGYLESFPIKNDTANTVKISKTGASETVRVVVMGVKF